MSMWRSGNLWLTLAIMGMLVAMSLAVSRGESDKASTGGGADEGKDDGVPLIDKLPDYGAQGAPMPRVGGANAPATTKAAPAFAIQLTEIAVGDFSIRVPTGEYTAPKGGAKNYTVPGPIAAFKGPDDQWRGRGYLETYPRLQSFSGQVQKADEQGNVIASLVYVFEGGKFYRAKVGVVPKNGVVLLDERSTLGPRNLFVFDCFDNWQPSAGFATNMVGSTHSFIYLPCYYDKPEVTVNPAAAFAAGDKGDGNDDGEESDGEAKAKGDAKPATKENTPGGVAVLHPAGDSKDVVGFWVRDHGEWQDGDRMGFQLWQRRQLPGDPASRHFQGPETKSDSTPNPRTAGMLGQSLYEGHVTIEFSLGVGTRKLGFAVAGKGATKNTVPQPFKQTMQRSLGLKK